MTTENTTKPVDATEAGMVSHYSQLPCWKSLDERLADMNRKFEYGWLVSSVAFSIIFPIAGVIALNRGEYVMVLFAPLLTACWAFRGWQSLKVIFSSNPKV